MLKSMTAFGRASASVNGREITVELRSVNNRFLDCSVRMPRTLGCQDDRVKPYLTSRGISRGKVDVNVSVGQSESEQIGLGIDEQYADAYIAALRQLRRQYRLKDDISVMKVAADRNIFTVKKPEVDAEQDWAAVLSVLEVAVDSFIAARQAEGQRIEADLNAKLENIKTIVDRIEVISKDDVENGNARIRERLNRLLSDLGVKADEGRILTECAAYADRIAIDEELVRLRSHFVTFDTILAADEPAGRKLDFLMQEMNREINTIGSKCQNADAARLVVDVKCELEKIREQIQNIE
ncbi:MAG: YicC family protein [Clostridia bacterium]|nr:YicC family protein [Clostridia bacterium]